MKNAENKEGIDNSIPKFWVNFWKTEGVENHIDS